MKWGWLMCSHPKKIEAKHSLKLKEKSITTIKLNRELPRGVSVNLLFAKSNKKCLFSDGDFSFLVVHKLLLEKSNCIYVYVYNKWQLIKHKNIIKGDAKITGITTTVIWATPIQLFFFFETFSFSSDRQMGSRERDVTNLLVR